MKRMIKKPARALWRVTHPIRRPFLRKIEAFFARVCAQPPILLPAPAPPDVHVHCRVTEETGYLMDFMIRELIRLQEQVDRLQQTLDDLNPASTGLNLVRHSELEELRERSVAG